MLLYYISHVVTKNIISPDFVIVSRYLFSGDSIGDILVWRADTKGWYRELLRKFKRDPTPSAAMVLNANDQNIPTAHVRIMSVDLILLICSISCIFLFLG
jgi:hypothetical protein